MIRRLAILAALLASTSAHAEVVVFSDMVGDAPEANLVRSFLGEAQVQTSVVDLDADGTTEVVVRLTDDCEGDACRTLVYRKNQTDWGPVLDVRATSLSTVTGGASRMPSFDVDGMVWKWSNIDGYRFDAVGTGDTVELQPAPVDFVQPLLDQFGPSAYALFTSNSEVRVLYAAVDTNDDDVDEVLVSMQGGGVCGKVYGCPFRLLEIVDGQYAVALEGFMDGVVSMSTTVRDGRRDIVSALPGRGYVVYGWAGTKYAQAQILKGE